MVARVATGTDSFGVSEPEPLPIKVPFDVTGWRYGYDVAALGQRFIVGDPVGVDSTPALTAIVNWTGLLRPRTA